MFERYIPEWLRHAPTPSVRRFAVLSAAEAVVRAVLVSVYPLAMYRAFGDAALVSKVYFAVGVLSLGAGLMVPWLTTRLPRRWVYTAGGVLFLVGCALGVAGGPWTAVALACHTVATVTVFICFNAYVLDHIARADLGRTETTRMFYGAAAWAGGPLTGVLLWQFWEPLPFLVSALAVCGMLGLFWYMRLGAGRVIQRARGPAPNPLAYLGRFFAQPRLVAGWIFAVVRSAGWWVYVVYLPIFAVQAGLGESLGGISMSIACSLMFTTPLMLRAMSRAGVRRTVRTGFAGVGVAFLLAAVLALAGLPWPAVAAMVCGSAFLVLLDISGGLPFLMAVRPSERTEMAAVYSSFRDVSGIVTPGVAAVVLLAAPLPAVFAAAGAGLVGCWALAGRMHPHLGAPHRRAAARMARRGWG